MEYATATQHASYGVTNSAFFAQGLVVDAVRERLRRTTESSTSLVEIIISYTRIWNGRIRLERRENILMREIFANAKSFGDSLYEGNGMAEMSKNGERKKKGSLLSRRKITTNEGRDGEICSGSFVANVL